MERLKKPNWADTRTINGVEYQMRVAKVSDLEQAEDFIIEQKYPPMAAARMRQKFLLTKCLSVKANGTFEPVQFAYFASIPAYEYTSLLKFFHQVNTLTSEEVLSDDADFLFEVMQAFGKIDFNILNDLTVPQQEWLRAQIRKRKLNEPATS